MDIDGRRVKVEDHREVEHYAAGTMAVLARDTFMSGWGEARDGESWAAWCCRPEDREQVLAWVKARGDTQDVSCVEYQFLSVPPTCVHISIYSVTDNHRALQ